MIEGWRDCGWVDGRSSLVYAWMLMEARMASEVDGWTLMDKVWMTGWTGRQMKWLKWIFVTDECSWYHSAWTLFNQGRGGRQRETCRMKEQRKKAQDWCCKWEREGWKDERPFTLLTFPSNIWKHTVTISRCFCWKTWISKTRTVRRTEDYIAKSFAVKFSCKRRKCIAASPPFQTRLTIFTRSELVMWPRTSWPMACKCKKKKKCFNYMFSIYAQIVWTHLFLPYLYYFLHCMFTLKTLNVRLRNVDWYSNHNFVHTIQICSFLMPVNCWYHFLLLALNKMNSMDSDFFISAL